MTEGVRRLVGERYRIERELGHGGMGVVYLGRDLRRDMDVAIKLCGRTDPHSVLWLKREFRVVASLRHPNLVELYELVAHEGTCYFTMEYVVGVDPRRWVQRPPAPPPQALPDDEPTDEQPQDELVEVPKLYGMGLSSAKKKIQEAGLVVGSVREREHPELGNHRVITQDPSAGSKVAKGTAVDLVVVTPEQ